MDDLSGLPIPRVGFGGPDEGLAALHLPLSSVGILIPTTTFLFQPFKINRVFPFLDWINGENTIFCMGFFFLGNRLMVNIF